jgi:hypothetical protein
MSCSERVQRIFSPRILPDDAGKGTIDVIVRPAGVSFALDGRSG